MGPLPPDDDVEASVAGADAGLTSGSSLLKETLLGGSSACGVVAAASVAVDCTVLPFPLGGAGPFGPLAPVGDV